MSGYGLDKDSAIWWTRVEIFKYGATHASSYNYCYGDALDFSVARSLSVVTKNSILNFSKIIINNVFPLFDDTLYFYTFILLHGSDILKFLIKYESKSNKYLIDIITKFVETNYYYEFISFGELVQLFPDSTVDDNDQLIKWVDEVISLNEKAVADFKGGKMGALNSLKGQVMKLSKGKANINTVGDIFLEKLK